MATALNQFLKLAPSVAEKAILNCVSQNKSLLTADTDSISSAIMTCIDWESTPEGHDFWSDVYQFAKNLDKQLGNP